MKALVLAGGFPQIALIQELKSRNIETVLADWNREPVAKKYSDVFYMASTLDVICLPMYAGLMDKDVERVIESVAKKK